MTTSLKDTFSGKAVQDIKNELLKKTKVNLKDKIPLHKAMEAQKNLRRGVAGGAAGLIAVGGAGYAYKKHLDKKAEDMSNKYLEKAAFLHYIGGYAGAKKGDKLGGTLLGGSVGGTLGGLGSMAVVSGAASLLKRNPVFAIAHPAGNAAIAAGVLAGGFGGGRAYSAIKKKMMGEDYHKKEASQSNPFLEKIAVSFQVDIPHHYLNSLLSSNKVNLSPSEYQTFREDTDTNNTGARKLGYSAVNAVGGAGVGAVLGSMLGGTVGAITGNANIARDGARLGLKAGATYGGLIGAAKGYLRAEEVSKAEALHKLFPEIEELDRE